MRKSTLVVTTSTVTVTAATGALTSSGFLTQALAVGDMVQVAGVRFAVTAVTDGAAGAAANVVVEPAPLANMSNVASASCFKLLSQGLEVVTQTHAPTVDSLTIQAHGINIYNAFPSGFFNSYTSYHFGGPNINTPEDIGCLFVPFCLYPGTYQPLTPVVVVCERLIKNYLS
jgi:hypothetical protein